MDKKNVLGWLLFLPLAFGIQAIISLLFGFFFIGIGLKNQLFLDGVNSFVGNFVFILSVGYLSPSNKIKTTEIIFWISLSLSILSLLLGILNVYSIVGMETPNAILPILQILGSLYAVTLVPIFITKGASLDNLLGKIAGLGGMTTGVGVVISILGLIIGYLIKNWTTLFVGSVIFSIGVITWIIPYLWLTIVFNIAKRKIKKYENI